MTALVAASLEASLDGLLILDGSNRVVRFNQRFLRLFGLTATQVEGLSGDRIVGLLKPDDRPPSSGTFGPLFTAADGRVIEMRSAALDGADGGGRLEIYRDVTEWWRCVHAAEGNRALLEAAQGIAHIGSWTWDDGPGCGQLHCSAEAARIFGIPADDFPVAPDAFLKLVYPDDQDAVRRATAAAQAAGDSHEIEHRIIRHGQDLRWLHVKARIVRDPEGKAVRMIGSVQDITERRMFEEQLRQSQKLEAIGRLAGGVAHDLNNALTAIVGYTELALGGIPGTHPAWPDVQEIRRAAERAEAVTRQLLMFSRKQRLEPRVFDLTQTIASLALMLERVLGVGIAMDTVVDEELPPIYGDPGQIQQALINLAVNARDAMEGGGRLSIRIRLARIDEAFAQTHLPMPAGDYVELSVADTGVGMTRDTQAHMFEPFFTTKEVGKGTGLGLPMVYGTVQQSGGFIFVESTLGRGSTFRMYFPPAAGFATEPAPAAVAPDGATILVAEDEAAVRALVVAALSAHGHRVLQAGSGPEALKIASDHAEPIDLLLTDANMPGMNGVELANEVVRRRGNMHIVIMSGYTPGALTVSGVTQPIAFLPKPFTPRELREKINEVLARQG
jgi:PAS domain S-box-containing protein